MTKAGKASGGIAGIVTAILLSVFALEGGYSNHPHDPGGETMYGVTERVARANGYTGPMKDLSKEVASKIYEQEYIISPGFDKIIERSPQVGHKLVDSGVNLGTVQQVKSLQRALNALNGNRTPNIKVDGVIGPATLTAVDELQKRYGARKTCELLIKLLDAQQAQHYMGLTNLKVFTVGWIDHRIGNVSCDQTY